jgi:hypothetical protein
MAAKVEFRSGAAIGGAAVRGLGSFLQKIKYFSGRVPVGRAETRIPRRDSTGVSGSFVQKIKNIGSRESSGEDSAGTVIAGRFAPASCATFVHSVNWLLPIRRIERELAKGVSGNGVEKALLFVNSGG